MSQNAQFVDDPLSDVPPGTSLRFNPTRMRAGFASSYLAPAHDLFNGAVMTIHYSTTETLQPYGSAVMVGQGVALTAWHVIEDAAERLRARSLDLLVTSSAKTGLQLWFTSHITRVPGTDIAILGLKAQSKLPSDLTYQHAVISTRPPEVGEMVMLAGVRGPDAALKGFDSTSVAADLLVSQGPVVERFLGAEGRDRLILPWPTVSVDAPSLGGMSGGAAFDARGCLIGLICRSIGNTMSDATPTYVSMVYAALNQKFEGGWPETRPFPRTLLEEPGVDIEGDTIHYLTDPSTGAREPYFVYRGTLLAPTEK